MSLSASDKREIAAIVAAEYAKVSGYSGQEGSSTPGQQEAATRAAGPLTRLSGSWNLTAAGTGGQEASSLQGPVEFDSLENTLHAGGKVLVTNFRGRVRQPTEAAGTSLQQGSQFGGILVLAYDTANNQYVELYADDVGKVQVSTTNRWEADGDTLRLYHDDYTVEYGAPGPSQFAVRVRQAQPTGQGTEAGTQSTIKSATLRRA